MRRRKGASFAELLVALLIISVSAAALLSVRNVKNSESEKELAIKESEIFAQWLRGIFLRAETTGRHFEIIGSHAQNNEINVVWLDNIDGNRTTRRESYSSKNASFSSQSSVNVLYNPVSNSTNPFGKTIMVHKKSANNNEIEKFVIVSRFGRVRVSDENTGE